jgi:hypothetical protein
MLVFSLVVCRGLRDTLWSLPVIIVILTMGILLIRAALRQVEFANFQRHDGSLAFSVYVYDGKREKFESFIHALTNQIQVAQKAAS